MMKNNTSLFSPKNPFLSPMFLPSLSLFHYHLIQVNVMMLQLSMRMVTQNEMLACWFGSGSIGSQVNKACQIVRLSVLIIVFLHTFYYSLFLEDRVCRKKRVEKVQQ